MSSTSENSSVVSGNNGKYTTITLFTLPPHAGLQIQILRRRVAPQVPALIYHGDGDCTWELKIKRSGTKFQTHSDSHKLELENSLLVDLQAECVVNGTILLDITINTTGEVLLDSVIFIHYCFVYISLQSQFQLQRMLH